MIRHRYETMVRCMLCHDTYDASRTAWFRPVCPNCRSNYGKAGVQVRG